MSKTEQVSVRIDTRVKKAAEAVFSKIGLSPAEAIRLFYEQVELHQGIPFDLRIPNEETLAAIRDVDEGKNLTSYENVEEMFESWERDL